jgi:hypothetical protein
MSASASEYFEHRKRQCVEDLRFADTTPGFRVFQVTERGGQQDTTELHRQRLRDACDAYQRAIDYLEGKSTALPSSNTPYQIK